MKNILSRLFLAVLLCSLLFQQNGFSQKPDKTAFKSITPELMKQYIGFLASDALLGRNTPSPGLDTAAAYIAKEFRNNSLSPVNGSYFQPFPLCKTDLDTGSFLRIIKDGTATSVPLKTGFVPYYLNHSKQFTGEVVFAGYGITAPEYDYDDYNGIDVKGKAVLIFRHEPCENDSGSFFEGKTPTKYSGLVSKTTTAAEAGAGALLVVTEPDNYFSLKPRGFLWPTLAKNLPAEAIPYTMCDDDSDNIPSIQIGEDAVKSLLGNIDDLRLLQKIIDSTRKPHSFTIPSTNVQLNISTRNNERDVVNVVGFIEGSDPVLKNEFVVIGAHYDHVGFKKQTKPGEDFIYNGADDNASGTSGVMAIAHAFSLSKEKPKRSVLFILFAGEEKGLYGSQYYTSHPLLPLDKTVAMFNLDMIGRNSPKTLNLVGAAKSPDIAAITRKANKKLRFTLSENNSVMGGSDHYNFYKKGIPFMFYFSGLHEDYHQVSDNPDKIDYKKAARVAQLVFLTAWQIANEDEHYTVITND
jgi:hypothetical protein